MGIDKTKKCQASRNDGGRCRNYAAWDIGGEFFCQAHAGTTALNLLERSNKAEQL